MSSEARVYLVDDDPEIREATQWLLQNSGFNMAVFPDRASFLEAFDPQRPGCLLLDIKLPASDGLELQKELLEKGVTIPVIFLTAHGDIPQSVMAIRRGAWEFLEKPYDPWRLIELVDQAVAYDLAHHRKRQLRESRSQRHARLTAREKEVARQVAAGRSSKGSSRILGLSHRTVDVHRRNLMVKLEVDSVAQLVQLLMDIGEDIPDLELETPDDQ